MVSDVNIGSALTQQSRTEASSQQLATDFSEFLQLLTIQLQNQDPLSPLETSEFTNQLVAFSGVEQQINTNQKLDSLVSLQLGNAMGSALTYVGLDASYVSTELYYDGQRPVEINYALQGDAVETKIRIVDEAGDIIFEADGNTSAGNNDFTWDGKTSSGANAPVGTYEVLIDSLSPDGEPVQSTTVVSGNVRGVETQNGLIFLLIGERAVSLSTVLNVSIPESIEEDNNNEPGGTDGGDGSGSGGGDDTAGNDGDNSGNGTG